MGGGGGGQDSLLSTSNNNNNCEEKFLNKTTFDNIFYNSSQEKQENCKGLIDLKFNNKNVKLCNKNSNNYSKINNNVAKERKSAFFNLTKKVEKVNAGKKLSTVQSTILLLSWLFVFILSMVLVFLCSTNKTNIENSLMAVGENTFAGYLNSHKGTEDDPHLISTSEDLIQFATIINKNGNSTPSIQGSLTYKSAYYKVMNDCVVETTFNTIGDNENNAFSGVFDGNGHNIEIQNVNWNFSFFGYISGANYKVEIKNLSLNIVCSIDGGMSVVRGIINNADNAIISNCKISGNIGITVMSGYDYVGAIVSNAVDTQIINCYATCKFKSWHDDWLPRIYEAGIVAQISGNSLIENCYANVIFTSGTEQAEIAFDMEGINCGIENKSNWSNNIWGNLTGDGYPYLRVFEEYSITYKANNGTSESQIAYYKKNQNMQVVGNEFGFTNGNMLFVGWQIVGDTSGKIYTVNDTITLNENITMQAVWGVAECSVKFNIKTNVGVVFMISDNNEFKQQIFVNKIFTYDDSEPTFTLSLTPNTIYTVIISTYYTTNINFANTNGQATTTVPSGQTLTNNVLTFTASENLIVRLNLNAFVGNNGIVI